LPTEDRNFVFIGATRGAGLSNMALLQQLRGLRRGLTVHGSRSTFKDRASERTNHPSIVSEMALAHTIKNKVEKAYRRGDLLANRAKLMADWAKVLFCCFGRCHTDEEGAAIPLILNILTIELACGI
jgi:hypothetical protein